MFRIVPHFTDLEPLIKPAPIKVPLAAWVELTGIPHNAAAPSISELDKSREKPWYGCICVIFVAIVFTIRQPPNTTPIVSTM